MNSVLAFQRSVEMAESSMRSGDFKRAVFNYDQALLAAPGAQDVKVCFRCTNVSTVRCLSDVLVC